MAGKEMSYKDNYKNILGYTKLLAAFIPPLVEKYLGKDGMIEVGKIWQEGLKGIPVNASYKEKYELAYANWMWKWSSAFDFAQTHLGESGVEEFKLADLEALKNKNSGLAMVLLNFIRTLSPGSAFLMIAKQMANEFQVFTPFSISEISKQRAKFNIPKCKILDYKGGESSCTIGCQSIFPMWMAEQLKVNMKTDRQGNSCTVTLTPVV